MNVLSHNYGAIYGNNDLQIADIWMEILIVKIYIHIVGSWID